MLFVSDDNRVVSSGINQWLSGLVGRRKRHVDVRAGRRVHVELRDLDDGEFAEFAEELATALDRSEGIEGYHVNGLTNRVVVSYRSALKSPEEIILLVEGIEAHCGVDDRSFPGRFGEYPSEAEALYRHWTEASSDLLGAALGVVLKLIERDPRPAEFDLAALVSVIEDSPRLRRRIEKVAGPEFFDVLLGTVNAFIQAVGSGPIGPIVDLIHQVASLKGVHAREEAWERLEPYVSPRNERKIVFPVEGTERPAPVPGGAIEQYGDEAWFASVGGFVVALADTHELESSTAPLFGGLPKAARYGRDGFVTEITRALSERDILVLDTDALALFDRIDTLLVDGQMCRFAESHVELLVATARQQGLSVVMTEVDSRLAAKFRARRILESVESLEKEVREMQEFGACVATIGQFRPEVCRAADLSVGVSRRRSRIPWGADIVIGRDLDDALFIIEAMDRAKTVSEHSVLLAAVGATLGTFLSLRGLRETNPRTIKLAVNAVSLVSLANGMARVREFERKPRPKPRDPTPWHAMAPADVLDRLETSLSGLEDRQVKERYRPPPEKPTDSVLVRRAVAEELSNPLTPILGAAASASAVVGSLTDAALVGSVVLFNAAIGGFERFRSERAVIELEEGEAPDVRVRRGGRERTVSAEKLVPGDIAFFEAGDIVPADCRLVSAEDLEVDESALTGESVPVRKSPRRTDADTVSERYSMLYDGTSIAGGEATAVVVAVGERTEANRSPVLGLESLPETGVERRLRGLTDMTLPMAGSGGALITAIGLLRSHDLQRLADTGLGMAVAAVPEGLPLLATVSQLATARRLSEHGVLVRNPRAIEALGRIDVLCADKTGTLTEGRIRLDTVSDGYRRARVGEDGDKGFVEPIVRAALRATPLEEGRTQLPHPTDQAVVDGARRLGVLRVDGERSWRTIDQIPFQPRRGFHSVLAATETGWMITVKGAPEVVIDKCSHLVDEDGVREVDNSVRRELHERAESLADEGLRVLCLAEKEVEAGGSLDEDRVVDLCFRGFVGLSDPARATAGSAVDRLRSAGIRTLMITGDHPKTAAHIARDVGLLDHDRVLTGPQVDELSDEELQEVLPETSVIARVTPSQKGRIVRALQATGRVVAMAGDGANDAGAIRLAEVGIALGPDATTAARDAADIVVLDEDIETMVHSVGEGRAMLEAVRDSVAILVGGNMGEIGFSVVGSLFEEFPPLNARQLLLVNLMTDIAPSMAIALKKPEEEHLRQLLEQDPADILGRQLNRALGVRATATGAGAMSAWAACRVLPGGHRTASTVGLLALVGTQLGQTVFLGNPTRETMLAGVGSAAALLGTVELPGLSQLFGCRPVGPIGLGIATSASAVATAGAALATHLGAGTS